MSIRSVDSKRDWTAGGDCSTGESEELSRDVSISHEDDYCPVQIADSDFMHRTRTSLVQQTGAIPWNHEQSISKSTGSEADAESLQDTDEHMPAASSQSSVTNAAKESDTSSESTTYVDIRRRSTFEHDNHNFNNSVMKRGSSRGYAFGQHRKSIGSIQMMQLETALTKRRQISTVNIDDADVLPGEIPVCNNVPQRGGSLAKVLSFRYNSLQTQAKEDTTPQEFIDKFELMQKGLREKNKSTMHLQRKSISKKRKWRSKVENYRSRFAKLWNISNPLFENQLKEIEARVGSGVTSYFLFSRWLLTLNIIICCLWTVFLVVPRAISFDYSQVNSTLDWVNILDGRGAVAELWFFYGNYPAWLNGYSNVTRVEVERPPEIKGQNSDTASTNNGIFANFGQYNTGMVYLLLLLTTYLGILLVITIHLATVRNQGQDHVFVKKYPFTTMIFSIWDYARYQMGEIGNMQASVTERFRDLIEEQRSRHITKEINKSEKAMIWGARCLAWTFTAGLLAAAIYALLKLKTSEMEESGRIGQIAGHHRSSFESALTITVINTLVPEVIKYLPRVEHYSTGKVEVNITIIRIFVFRLANLCTVLTTMFYFTRQKELYRGCLGSMLGQDMYLQVWLDTLTHSTSLLVLSLFTYAVTQKKVPFDMSRSVLIIVYRQALIWTGTMVSPVMPLLGTSCQLLYAGTSYVTVKYIGKPPRKRWQERGQNTLFYIILFLTALFTFPLFSVILGWPAEEFLSFTGTSNTCGPFRHGAPIKLITLPIMSLPHKIGEHIFSRLALICCIVLLSVVVYYQRVRLVKKRLKRSKVKVGLDQERLDNIRLLRRLDLMVSLRSKNVLSEMYTGIPEKSSDGESPLQEDSNSLSNTGDVDHRRQTLTAQA